MTLNKDFRIVNLDKLNITWERYREVINSKGESLGFKWCQDGGYYSNLNSCLNSIKETLIKESLDTKDVDNFIKTLNSLELTIRVI